MYLAHRVVNRVCRVHSIVYNSTCICVCVRGIDDWTVRCGDQELRLETIDSHNTQSLQSLTQFGWKQGAKDDLLESEDF